VGPSSSSGGCATAAQGGDVFPVEQRVLQKRRELSSLVST